MVLNHRALGKGWFPDGRWAPKNGSQAKVGCMSNYEYTDHIIIIDNVNLNYLKNILNKVR